MFWRTHKRKAVDEADLEPLRGLYGALGLGFPAEALGIFSDDGGRESDDWCLYHNGRRRRCLSAPTLSNYELFALPTTWEVQRVVARDLTARQTKRGDLVAVGGELYCRPRGSWENVRLPFFHLWTMCAGKALLFDNLLDGTQLRPRARLERCTA